MEQCLRQLSLALTVQLKVLLGPTGPTLLPGPAQRLGWLGSRTPAGTRPAFELPLTLELLVNLTVLLNCFSLFC
jgi:hypothetical protein